MYKAIGVIELKSIPKGVEAADAALKSAGIDMVSAHPACPGKYEIIMTGTISNVEAAVSHVNSRFEGYVIDSSVALTGRSSRRSSAPRRASARARSG